MQVYRLMAYFHSFNGTDHEPDRDSRIVAISQNRETLEELRNTLFGKTHWRDTTPYQQACIAHYQQHNHWEIRNPKFDVKLSDGRTIKVDIMPMDQFYGAGSLQNVSLEEFEYITPDEFI